MERNVVGADSNLVPLSFIDVIVVSDVNVSLEDIQNSFLEISHFHFIVTGTFFGNSILG